MGSIVDQMLDVLGLGVLPTTFPELVLYAFKFSLCSGVILYMFGTLKYWMASIFGAGRRLF